MEEIYKEYSIIIYKYIFSFVHDSSIAEDIMQDVFYAAIIHVDKMPKDTGVLPWLYTIAKNKCMDYFRKRKKIINIPLDENFEIAYYENFENNLEYKALYDAIDKLDNTSKQVILLKMQTELTFKEIGNMLGKNESWAKSTYYRAKNKIKEVLENE